jgi:hypothetical protein
MPAADTRAAGGTASWLTRPASTLTHSSVCPRASDRKSAGSFFLGKYLRGGSTPSFSSLPRPRRVRLRYSADGSNHSDLPTNQIRRLDRQALVMSLGPAIFQHHAAVFTECWPFDPPAPLIDPN